MIPIVTYHDRDERLQAILSRKALFDPDVDAAVEAIIREVRNSGDQALMTYTRQFDGVEPPELAVSLSHLEQAYLNLPGRLKSILEKATDNVRRFHEKQRQQSWFSEDGDGVLLGQRIVPIERVGVYVPGGKAFYPSSLIMNVVPAQVAGVRDIRLVSPPGKNGRPNSIVLAAAHLLGVEHVYAVGGAQAIAALAFGTETITPVDKIVGPGNIYVATAKKKVYGPVSIDSVAGPSEIVVLADAGANPRFIAADLLSQAEHDEDASAILITPDRALAESVRRHVIDLAETLSRRSILEKSLTTYGACIVTRSMREAVEAVNILAPEHLELLVEDPWQTMTNIQHAGAIFLGPYSSEPVGDYFAGPNHVLPTGGTARYASALNVDDFVRKQSIIQYSQKRLQKTGRDIIDFAQAEELTAHALAIQVRLEEE